jgi:hypothetical protein
MHRPDPTGSQYPALGKQRTCGVLRTVLITCGVAVGAYLFTQSVPAGAMPAAGGLLSPRSLVVLGLVFQALLIGARVLIRRHVPDAGMAVQGMFVMEPVGDGVTVLLFAPGTFGAILQMPDIRLS